MIAFVLFVMELVLFDFVGGDVVVVVCWFVRHFPNRIEVLHFCEIFLWADSCPAVVAMFGLTLCYSAKARFSVIPCTWDPSFENNVSFSTF